MYVIDGDPRPKSDAQSNDPGAEVPCKAGDPPSEGTDTYEFVCQERLAADRVIIEWAGPESGELAEVVVVGKTWGKLCHLSVFLFCLKVLSCNGFFKISFFFLISRPFMKYDVIKIEWC